MAPARVGAVSTKRRHASMRHISVDAFSVSRLVSTDGARGSAAVAGFFVATRYDHRNPWSEKSL
jgi:hypothetical protein